MLDYQNFPPIDSFRLVLQHEPKSATLYASIWEKRWDEDKRCAYPKDKIKKMFFISKTLFRNHLIALVRLGILTFEETPQFFLIDFCGAHES